MSTRLETPRLVIRTFEQRDAEPWIAMVSDPEVRELAYHFDSAGWGRSDATSLRGEWPRRQACATRASPATTA